MSASEEWTDWGDPDDLEVPDCPDDTASLTEAMDWHLNRFRWYRRKAQEAADQRDRMKARYDDWYTRVAEPWLRKAAESEAWIEYAVTDQIERHPSGPKTFRLPAGTVRTVSPRPSVQVEDLEAFRSWVIGRDDGETLARWRCEPVKEAVRQVLADGELVPGVRLEAGARRVSISVDDDE